MATLETHAIRGIRRRRRLRTLRLFRFIKHHFEHGSVSIILILVSAFGVVEAVFMLKACAAGP